MSQLLGIPLGLLLGTRKIFQEVVYPVVELLRPIPPLAWVPLSILFWPTAELSIIFITFIGPFFIIVINVYDGVRSIRKEHLWLARSFGATPGYIFRRIILPARDPIHRGRHDAGNRCKLECSDCGRNDCERRWARSADLGGLC